MRDLIGKNIVLVKIEKTNFSPYNRKFDNAKAKSVIEDINAGINHEDIKKKYSLSKTSMRSIVKKIGVQY